MIAYANTAGLVLIAAASCDRTTPERTPDPVAPERAVADAAPVPQAPLRLVATIRKEITIGPDDVLPMEIVDVTHVAAPGLTQGKVGPKRKVMSGQHLRLASDEPLATNRGFIEVTDGPEWNAKTTEAVLIDFASGEEVTRVRNVFGNEPLAGFAFGRITGDSIVEQSVIIHPDGHTVKWAEPLGYEPDLDVLVHPGRKEVYIVRINRDDPHDGTTTFSKWTDLRRPPPPTSHVLPIQPYSGDEDDGLFGQYKMPGRRDPANVNLTASNATNETCKRVEILPDASARCIPRGDIVLADGWHLRAAPGEWTAFNEALGEVQHLTFAKSCGASGSKSSPPRVLFDCRDAQQIKLWGPDKTRTIAKAVLGEGYALPAKADGRIVPWGHSFTRSESGGELCQTALWLDLVAYRGVRTPRLALHSGASAGAGLAVNKCGSSGLDWLDLENATLTTLVEAGRCQQMSVHLTQSFWAAYSCESTRGRPRWFEVVNFETRTTWRLTRGPGSGPYFGRVWLQPDPATVVWIDAGKSRADALVWDLKN